jgi:hypothetical protein
MIMLVKKATFRTMGSGGKGRTGNRWDVSGAGVCTTGNIYFHSKYIKSQRLTIGATTDLFLVTLQSAVL